MKAERVFTSGTNIYPLTITLKDDDTGEAGTYTIDKLDVMVNYNDENDNGIDDRDERGFEDKDLRELDLSHPVSSGMDKDKGGFCSSRGSTPCVE